MHGPMYIKYFFCQVAMYRVLVLFDSHCLLLPVAPLLQVQGAWCVAYVNKIKCADRKL